MERTAVITGATGNLGQYVTLFLLKKNIRVVAMGRSVEKLEDLKKKSPSQDLIRTYSLDLTSTDEVANTFNQILQNNIKIDYLVHIAGGFAGGKSVAESNVETWNRMMDMNLKSAYLCSRAVLPSMIKNQFGKIITISAMAGIQAKANRAPYAVSKAGLIFLTKSIAAEVKSDNIQANSIAPGIIDTPDNRDAMPDADTSNWITTERIAKTIWFLCSESGQNVTGCVLEMP